MHRTTLTRDTHQFNLIYLFSSFINLIYLTHFIYLIHRITVPYVSIQFVFIDSIHLTHFIHLIYRMTLQIVLLYLFYFIYLNQLHLRSCIFLGNLHFTLPINHHQWDSINIVSPSMSLPFSLTIRSLSCFSM